MQEFAEQIIDFLPPQTVFWSALGTTLVAALIQFVSSWYMKKSELPWMKEKNRKKKAQIIATIKQAPQRQSKSGESE